MALSAASLLSYCFTLGEGQAERERRNLVGRGGGEEGEGDQMWRGGLLVGQLRLKDLHGLRLCHLAGQPQLLLQEEPSSCKPDASMMVQVAVLAIASWQLSTQVVTPQVAGAGACVCTLKEKKEFSF